MKIEHSIKIGQKRYQYTITPVDDDTVHFECLNAGISQQFKAEDIPGLLMDLPELIKMKKEFEEEYNQMIRFRLSAEEKEKIQQTAFKKGYKSVSAFLRDVALNA